MDADSRARSRAFTDVSNTHALHAAAADGQLNNSKPSTQQRRAKPVVTSSGFRGAAVKQQIQQLISQFGGAYSGELVQGHTTHLVCKRLIDCFATPKYQRALEWGVHIVSYDWLLASAAAGQAVPEQDYKDDALDALKPSPAPPARQQQQQQQHQCQFQHKQGPLEAHLPLEAEQEQWLQCGWQQEHASAAALDPPGQQQQQHQKAVRQQQHQQQQQQQQQQQPATAAGTSGSSNSPVLCAELPANFLLLGPESPVRSDGGDAPCSRQMHASPSAAVNRNTMLCRQQQQQQRQQQQSLEQPSPLPQPAAAAGVLERGFQFCMQLPSGSPQQTSPCMQSFLPMQQQQQQALSGSFVQQHAVSATLAGSELQPDGVLEVPVLASAPAAAAAAALGFGPETGAGACSRATVQAYCDKQQQEQQQQRQLLLIPETQCEDLLAPPRCGTPESLAHYVNKQRRRQRAAAAAAAPLVQQAAQSMGHAAPAQTEAADCTAAGADAGAAVGTANTCADMGAAEGLVRLRCMGGYGAGEVSGASSSTPTDCADLEDSDCELEGTAGGSSSTPTTAAEGSAGGASVGDASAATAAAEASTGGVSDDDAATDLEDSDWGLDGATSPSSRKSDALCDTTDLLHNSYEDAADTVAGSSCRSSSPLRAKADRQQGRRLRTTAAAAAAQAAAAAAAAAAVFAASAGDGGSTQQESQEHVTPHTDRRQGGCGCDSRRSCSGSSLPSGPSPAAVASAADSDAAYYSSASGTTADTAGAAAAARGASKQSLGDSESASLAGDNTCMQEADNSQGRMPVMRLNFSPGGRLSTGCSTADRHQQTSAHTQQEEGEEWAGLEEEGGRGGESDGSEDETQCTGSGTAWSPAANSEATSGSGSGSSGGDSSKRSTGSSSSRLWLPPGSAAAAAGRTAAALLQKRQQLKQQQQRDDSMLALDGSSQGPVRQQLTAATPPSEGSLFVTRRKAPRPAAGPAAAAAVCSGVTSGSDSEDDSAADGCVVQCRRVRRLAAAPPAATADSSEEEEEDVWEMDSHSKRGGGGAAVAGAVLPAEQLLQDLKQQQQGIAGGGAALQLALGPASEPQQEQEQKHHNQRQQKGSPAEAFLRDLQRQQQQQQQGTVHESTSAFTDFPQPPAAAAAAGPKQSRHSVSSSSCAGPQLSTASRKVPLQLQGAAIVLQGASSSTASSSCVSSAAGSSGEDGLSKALQQALAAVTAASGSSAAARSSAAAMQPQQQQQLPEAAEAACLDEQQEQQQAGEQAGQEQEVAGGAVSWLHTPEGPQQQQQQDLDLVGMPTVGVAARGAAMSNHLGARLAQLSQTHEEVVPLKLLQKAPRGSTAKAHHGLKPGSKLTYADQVQVPWAHATLSTKERSRCVIVAGSSGSNGDCSSGSSAAAFIGEPVAFYRLPSGDWWVELLRFYSAKDLRELAKGCGQAVHLPPDFQLSYELLRGMRHEHWPMRQVQGEFKLSKVRKAPTGTRIRAQSPFFWRYSVDTSTCQLLTDRPVTDLVVQ